MKKIFLTGLITLLASTCFAAPTVEFLPDNDDDDHIMYSSHLIAPKPNSGITELSMQLIFGDFVYTKESIIKVETKDSDFTMKSCPDGEEACTAYYWAPISFRVNLKDVRRSINSILQSVGDDARGGKFHFLLTHTSTSVDSPQMPLLSPLSIDIEDFADRLTTRITSKPFHSIFHLYDGGERQLDPANPRRSTILLGYQIQFFRTLLKGSFPSFGKK